MLESHAALASRESGGGQGCWESLRPWDVCVTGPASCILLSGAVMGH